MADTTTLHIALQSARELEIDVEDPDAIRAAIETALKKGETMVWIADSRGHRFGFLIEKLAFIEFEGTEGRPGVGFGATA